MDDRRRSHLASALPRIALGLTLSIWITAPAAGAPFEGRGRVTAVDPGRNTVRIAHDAIPDLLPVRESEFPVEPSVGIGDLHPGDRIRFTLGTADESHGLLTVSSVAREDASMEWSQGLLLAAAIFGCLSVAAVAAVGTLLWRQLRTLQSRVIALDHETGLLRGLVSDTQDGVGQIARSLEEAATTFRVGYVQELSRRLAPGAGRTPSTAAGGADTAALAVVQRGRGDLYRAVERGVAGPGLAVIWDRRRSERRRAARRPLGHERRHVERRGSPSETWMRLGFQLVATTAAPAAHTPRLPRATNGERGPAH
jgi:nitrate reductase NapE component